MSIASLVTTPEQQLSSEPLMPANAFGPLVLFLALLLAASHLFGDLFARLHQPRVIGEILAGIVLGPFVLGQVPAYTRLLQLNVQAAPRTKRCFRSTSENKSRGWLS